MSQPANPANPVEQIKEVSHQLRGSIAETLADPASTHFGEADYQLLKFHGTYQQDDRDLRAERKRANLDKAWSFMVRTKQPGGNISAAQYLQLDRLAGDIANGTLRITTRQGVQFHGIVKGTLREAMQRIHESGLTTWGACGDVVRNTMGPSSPFDTPAHRDATRLAQELSGRFLAKSSAYADIWLDGEKVQLDAGGATAVEEPVYGDLYLPRKFKIGIAIPPSNDVDVYSQDLGFLSDVGPEGEVRGYTVVVGGGFGMSHGQAKTYPVLAKPLFYVACEHAVEAAVAIVTTQRDHGDRSDRKHARLKYLIEDRGLEWFRAEVISRLAVPVEPARAVHFDSVADDLGWHPQGDGKWFCCIRVEVGRIRDIEGGARYRTVLRRIAKEFGFPMRFTPNTNILFFNIDPSQRGAVEALLAEHGIAGPDTFTEARKTSHACVALPTCGLSLAESERVFPGFMDEIDAVLRELGLEKEPILFRMTGCPNGCARPYNADFAFVGRAPNKYAFYVGGSIAGERLAGLEKKTLPGTDIAETVREYLTGFKAGRTEGETFTAWWGRARKNGEAPHPDQFHVELAERAERLKAAKENAIPQA